MYNEVVLFKKLYLLAGLRKEISASVTLAF
jgi:hypothetical protein